MDSISVCIQWGGSFLTVNGVNEYMPLTAPRRMLVLPSPLTYSSLYKRVAKKLCLRTPFTLWYKNPIMNNATFQIADDEDVPMFWNGIHQSLPEVLMLYVVLYGDDGGQLQQQIPQPFPQYFHQFQQ